MNRIESGDSHVGFWIAASNCPERAVSRVLPALGAGLAARAHIARDVLRRINLKRGHDAIGRHVAMKGRQEKMPATGRAHEWIVRRIGQRATARYSWIDVVPDGNRIVQRPRTQRLGRASL